MAISLNSLRLTLFQQQPSPNNQRKQTISVFEQAHVHLCNILTSIESIHPDKVKQIPHLLLGLSGGADSIFLFHLLLHAQHQKKLTFTAAHLNHQWRDDAQETVDFCAELCKKNQIPFIVDKLENYKHLLTFNGSSEAYGRQARQLFFKTICTEKNIPFLLLGHHADDQIESFFIKLIRGATLEGICGMQTIAQNSIRPLLIFAKKDLVQYLTDNNVSWHHDSTNDSELFLRNSIRSKLIPLINEIDPRSSVNIQRLQAHAQLDNDFFIIETKKALSRIQSQDSENKQLRYQISAFFNEHPAIQKRILTQLLYAHRYQGNLSEAIILEIIRFLMHNQGGEHLIKNLVLHKKQGFFWFA